MHPAHKESITKSWTEDATSHLRQEDVNCGIPQLIGAGGVGRGQVGQAACQHGCACIGELRSETAAFSAMRLVLQAAAEVDLCAVIML